MGFTDTDIQPLSYTYGFNTESVEVGFGLDTDNNWDVECQFVVDPGYVTAYNAENGTAVSGRELFIRRCCHLAYGDEHDRFGGDAQRQRIDSGRIYVTYSFG